MSAAISSNCSIMRACFSSSNIAESAVDGAMLYNNITSQQLVYDSLFFESKTTKEQFLLRSHVVCLSVHLSVCNVGEL